MVSSNYPAGMDISETISSYLQKADKLLEKAAKETDVDKGLSLRSMAETYVAMAGVLSKTDYPPRPTPSEPKEGKAESAKKPKTEAEAYDLLDPILDFLIGISRTRH